MFRFDLLEVGEERPNRAPMGVHSVGEVVERGASKGFA